MKVYEPKKEPCKICEVNDSTLLPICVIDGELKMFPVCRDCVDKIPYKEIPVKSKMGKGYYFFQGEWKRGR
tara:strand:+ start:252 stop:464 length:213 start_codon:yes stop_codon:yes gene_type:complete